MILIHPWSLLSDSNQRPRDYKSRALANWAKEAFISAQQRLFLFCECKGKHFLRTAKLFRKVFSLHDINLAWNNSKPASFSRISLRATCLSASPHLYYVILRFSIIAVRQKSKAHCNAFTLTSRGFKIGIKNETCFWGILFSIIAVRWNVNMRTDSNAKRYLQTLPLMGATRLASG